jgi:hypothetical protein
MPEPRLSIRISRSAPVATRSFALAVVATALASATPSEAQLRPLEPLDWEMLGSSRTAGVSVGGAVLAGQTAALAGSRGRLTELGNYRFSWRTGRVLLTASGTAVRSFEAEAAAGAGASPAGTTRARTLRDAGDHRIATAVRLTPARSLVHATLRFGTRLPTTDDRIGLDRDQTDFFALLGGSLSHGPLFGAAEAGVGIHGTRDPEFEQADVILYNARIELSRGRWAPSLTILGQADTFRGWEIPGNENLGEVRIGLRFGERYRLQTDWVRGFERISPSAGLLISLRAMW